MQPNKNKDLIEKAGPTWSSLNRSSIHDIRMDLIDQVRAADLASETKKYGSGRGIVFTAGNADTIQRVIWTLKVMRNGASASVLLTFARAETLADQLDRRFLVQFTTRHFLLRSTTSRTVS